jgi:hypothetical protein
MTIVKLNVQGNLGRQSHAAGKLARIRSDSYVEAV